MSAGAAIFRDLRHAALSLRRSPGFTVAAVLTLGLGIGANTSAFSMVNEILMRPLPYRDSQQLERIYRSTPQNSRGGVSPADFLDLEHDAPAYGQVAAYAYTEMTLSAPGEPAQFASGARVSPGLFPLLGVEPVLGRGFRPDEAARGNHRVLVISHSYWQEQFGADARVIGRTVRVDGEVHEIVGVLPPTMNDWRHLGNVKLFRPLGFSPAELADRGSAWLRVMGRPHRHLSDAQRTAFVEAFGRRMVREHPVPNVGATWRKLPMDTAMVPENAPLIIWMVVGLSGFVLLIACSNLANLLLARTMARSREFAVRSALGASQTRLLRPLLLESVLLAAIGGTLAMILAEWSNGWITMRTSQSGLEGLQVGIDWHVLVWAFGACLFTVVAFGVAPALFIVRLDPNQNLRSGARGNTGGRGQRRFRHALIVGQFALAMVLLAGATLLVRGIEASTNRRIGWTAERVVSGTMLLPGATYTDPARISDFQRTAVERLEAIPGVASASISYSLPFFGSGEHRKYLIAGRDAPRPGREPGAALNGVSPRYFETVGTRVLSGRAFSDGDRLDAPRVFIINQAMAEGLFAGGSPIGQRIAQADGETLQWGEIVGVVADTRSVFADQADSPYQVYQPVAQAPRLYNEIAVLTSGAPPASITREVRSVIMALDPDLPVRNLEPAEAAIARANYQPDMLGDLLAYLALLGLGLAALGLFGVIARTVAQRTDEFGIRMALGAVSADIIRLVLGSGTRLALAGAGIGLLGAAALTRSLASMFPNMPASQGQVLGGVTLLLVSVALLASYLPARRAARISPADALRAQ
jgi:putative ABC transport system permease protein